MPSVEDLETLPKEELLARWRRLPGNVVPPARVDRLRRELAYREQERRHGRLDKNTAVSLRRHMAGFEQSLRAGHPSSAAAKPPAQIALEAGSVLSRDWNGRRIVVQVAGPREFVWEGERFKSLSALARRITGQHLSGPLFFGLKEDRHG